MAMFTPFVAGGKGEAAGKVKPAAPSEEVADLKEEMEAMRRQLAELSQRK
jgi:polyhydroxyalkanoate synthesis regulator protein